MSAPRNHIGIGAASIRPTSAPKSSRARAASSLSCVSSASLSLKSNTQISAAPPGETAESASDPCIASDLPDPGETVMAIRNGFAVFCVRRTCWVSSSTCSSLRPRPSGPVSSLRYSGTLSSPIQRARRSGASILPSARTSSGMAGPSSIMRDRRCAARRLATDFCSRPVARSITHTAPAVHSASRRPIMASSAGEDSITRQLCGRARGCNARARNHATVFPQLAAISSDNAPV